MEITQPIVEIASDTYSSYVLKLPFMVISFPYYVYTVLTWTLTLTLDIWTLSTLFIIVATTAFYVIRFKYLTKYSRLPAASPLFTRTPFDLHPNTTLPQENDSNQEDYMDVFLASIKVFGYLERPIFHELSRQMEIKKLGIGEVLYDEQNPTRDFIIVVEGTVDLFVKSPRQDQLDNESEMEGYILLNRVKSGGAVSSLFGILSVLTDDLSVADFEDLGSSYDAPSLKTTRIVNEENESTDKECREKTFKSNIPERIQTKINPIINIHPNVIARTSSKVTLATIPAEAFHSLAQKHPLTAAHFAQVILTRFQRVTFSTLNRYLGLSRELLTIEKRVNEISGCKISPIKGMICDEDAMKDKCFDYVSYLIGMDSSVSYSTASTPDLRDERQWSNDIVIQNFEPRDVIAREGERVAGIYYVIQGVLNATFYDKTSESSKILFTVEEGGLAGYVAHLTGYPSFVSLSAKTKVQVAFFSKAMVDKMIERCPIVLLTLAKRLMRHVSPLVLQIDLALEWAQVSAGQVLYRQGDSSESIHYVLSGRLRCIVEPSYTSMFVQKKMVRKKTTSDSLFEHAFGSPVTSDNSPVGSPDILILPPSQDSSFEILGEYGQNDSIGEMHVLTMQPRSGTLYAIRDTELTVMSKTLFEALASLNPSITLQISRIIANRSPLKGSSPQPLYKMGLLNGMSCHDNLSAVAIIPTHGYVPVAEFAERLSRAVQLLGDDVIVLNTETVMNALGKHAFTRLGRLKLNNWLAEQEETARLVLYVADGGVNNPWTARCVRQADSILFVGLGEESGLGEFEQLVMYMKTTARKELALIYPNRGTGRSATWLKERPWITMHHHVCMRAVKVLRNGTIEDLRNIKIVGEGLRSDFARLARRLLNKSIGLVLGGGGARGFAHAGIIRALDEAGVPIDMVGGTSMGAFVGGIYAKEYDTINVFSRCKMFATRASSVWRKLFDLTYPFTALFYGHEFNRGIWKVFLDTHVEDCWIPFFCNTTNITFQRMEVHRFGYMWRYIRASMSLAGYLPPLCENGSLLVDGGYLNNLPADIMRQMGAKTIIAIDVGLAEDTSPVNYGDTLSGWTILFQKLNPFARYFGPDIKRIPSMAEIQTRLAYISSVKQLDDAKGMDGVLCMRPDVLGYGTLEFTAFKKIFDAGYESGKRIIDEWQNQHVFQEYFGMPPDNESNKMNRRASI